MRVGKILGLGLVGLVLLVGVIVTTIALGGAPLIAYLIEHQGSTPLGRQIRVGNLSVSWGRPTRIIAEHITVENAAWGSSPIMLAVGRLDMQIEPGALLGVKLMVPQLLLEDASLLLETSPDGTQNWAPLVGTAHAQRAQVQRLVLRDGTFRYHNGQTGAETEISAGDLVARFAHDRNSISPTRTCAPREIHNSPCISASLAIALSRAGKHVRINTPAQLVDLRAAGRGPHQTVCRLAPESPGVLITPSPQ